MLKMTLFKCIRTVILTSIASPLLLIAAPSATQSLQSRLDALKTYSADFTQTTVANHQITAKAQGHMSIQRPWHLRWTITKPSKQMLIVNGSTVWNYNPDLAQATKQLLNDQEKHHAAMLLASNISIAKQFNVMQLTLQKKPLIIQYQLTPKRPTSVTHINLNFSPIGLVSMQTSNQLGQTNHYQFSHIAVNQALKASLFDFIPPKGVDVLQAGHMND